MRPKRQEERIRAFRRALACSDLIPESDIGTMRSLGVVASAFLIGQEKELYQKAKGIAVGVGGEMFRRTPIAPIEEEVKQSRLRTVEAIFTARLYFEEHWPCEEMIGLLCLLMSLAVDSSDEELARIAIDVVVDAVEADADLWNLLEEEFADFCRLIGKVR